MTHPADEQTLERWRRGRRKSFGGWGMHEELDLGSTSWRGGGSDVRGQGQGRKKEPTDQAPFQVHSRWGETDLSEGTRVVCPKSKLLNSTVSIFPSCSDFRSDFLDAHIGQNERAISTTPSTNGNSSLENPSDHQRGIWVESGSFYFLLETYQ